MPLSIAVHRRAVTVPKQYSQKSSTPYRDGLGARIRRWRSARRRLRRHVADALMRPMPVVEAGPAGDESLRLIREAEAALQ